MKTDSHKIFNAGYFDSRQQEIREHWTPIVKAAGLYHGLPSATELFLLASLLMDDEIVHQRSNAIAIAAPMPAQDEYTTPDKYPSTLAVLAMTDEERSALQQRIFALIRKDKIVKK